MLISVPLLQTVIRMILIPTDLAMPVTTISMVMEFLTIATNADLHLLVKSLIHQTDVPLNSSFYVKVQEGQLSPGKTMASMCPLWLTLQTAL